MIWAIEISGKLIHRVGSNCYHNFNYAALEKVNFIPPRQSLPRRAKKVRTGPPPTSVTEYGLFEWVVGTQAREMRCEVDAMKARAVQQAASWAAQQTTEDVDL